MYADAGHYGNGMPTAAVVVVVVAISDPSQGLFLASATASESWGLVMLPFRDGGKKGRNLKEKKMEWR